MRIALVSGSFLPRVGGLEWKVHYLATEYVKRGHEVIVFTSRPRISFEPVRLPVETSYRVIRCGIPLPGFGRLSIAKYAFCKTIKKHHRLHAFDVLHCHHLGFPSQVGATLKSVIGVPVVATTCGADVQIVPEINYGERLSPRLDRIVRDNLKKVDVVGSISSSVRTDLEGMQPCARIVDIPNGVPWDEFQTGPSKLLRTRLNLGPETIIILSVGRNHIKKGYDLGIRAFARVAKYFEHAHYILVGRNTETLTPLVEDCGMKGRVHLVGQVPFQEVSQVFHSADVFFNPSLVEGFAQVNAQALASGLPCVLTDAPGNVDAADYGGALIAKAGDIEMMASILIQLLGNSQNRETLGREAHAASKRYAWEKIADEYLHIFEGLCKPTR